MEPLTGLAALVGVSIATIAGLRLKKESEEGFASLPPRDYRNAVNTSQSRYNMFSGLVNPITNAIIPVGSSSSTVNRQRDRVRGALGSYSAEFDPNSKETVALTRFQNKFVPQADGSKSLYAAARFCRTAGSGNQPFTTYNPDGSVKTRGAVDPTGNWKFDEVCGVCITDGIDEEGNRFRRRQGMLVEPGMKNDAYQEQQENGWSYPRIGPSIGSCNGAPNGPTFATNAKDLERFRSRKACADSKTIGGSSSCGMCYDSDVFSSIPPDTEINDIEIHVYGVGELTYRRGSEEITGKVLQETTPLVLTVQDPKETESFSLIVNPIQGRETATSLWGFLQSKTPREGLWNMPLNLILTVDDATGTTPSKSGGFFRFEEIGLDVAKMRPGAGKREMRLRGIIPFTFVGSASFPAMDCLDGPFQTKAQSLSAFATDQPCFVKGSRPGNYNDACLRARILDAGCTNEGDLFKNPRSLNQKDGADQNLNQIYNTLQEIAMNDMVDPDATKQCSGRTISTPCDPFILRQGTLKIGEAIRGTNDRLKTQGEQCLSYLYHNRGANETAQPPRVGATYDGLPGFRNNRRNERNIYCLPEGSLNPDTNASGKETLARIADNGYRGKIGVDAVKLYLTDQLILATDSMRNANTDPDRKAAIINCFGRDLNELAVAPTGDPRLITNPCGVLAQFVRVLPSQQVNDSFIEIAQLVVVDKNGENVAVGKSTAGTSPAWPSQRNHSMDASTAIDGNMFAKSANFYHSATAGGRNQFLLNLGAMTDITKIIYYTRGDNPTNHRKQGIRLQLLDSNQRVVDEKMLNNQLVEEISYLQAGSPATCKSSLLDASPLSFRPTNIPGCQLWLDASDSASLSLVGTTVTQWRDKSGLGNNTIVNGSPTIGNTISSKQAITTGPETFFTGPISIRTPTITCFAVATTTLSLPQYRRDQRLVSLANGTNVDYGRTDGVIALFNQQQSSTIATWRVAPTFLATNTIQTNTPFLAVSQYTGSSASLFFNGNPGSPLPSSSSSGPFAITKYGIGNQANPTSEVWIGHIGEVLIFNTSLTTFQRQQIEGYLAWKWGLQSSLSEMHPFKKSPPS